MRTILLILAFVGLIPSGFAQQLLYKHYSTETGLPSNEVYQITQDSSDHILIATDRGAVRFDGYSFENVLIKPGKLSYPVYHIYKSPAGKIYMSGAQGLIYEYSHRAMSLCVRDNAFGQEFTHSGILVANSIAEWQDTLWVNFNTDRNFSSAISSGYITRSGGHHKINHKEGFHFDLKRLFFHHRFSNRQDLVQHVYITWEDGTTALDSIALDWDHNYVRRPFYVALEGYQLLCIGRKLFIYKNKKRITEHRFDANVLSIGLSRHGELMIGFENKGAALYKFNHGSLKEPVKEFLPGISVTSIHEDHQEGFWFSSHESGLFYLPPALTKYWENPEPVQSMITHRGKTYVGYLSGVVEVYEDDRRIEVFKLPLLRTNPLLNFFVDEEDAVICITWYGAMKKINGRWKMNPFKDVAILERAGHSLFAASVRSGVVREYPQIGGKIIKSVTLPKRIVSMCTDRDGKLWLGTLHGLYLYTENGLEDLREKNAVFGDRIVSVKQLENGSIAVASLSNGIVMINEGDTTILNRSTNFNFNFINSLETDKNVLWVGTTDGLYKILYRSGQVETKRFGFESGLPTVNITSFKINNGWIYIKWMNRLAILSQVSMEKSKNLGSLYFRNVFAKGKNISLAGNLRLPRNENDLLFSFNVVNLAAANGQTYEYKLDGYDRRWNKTREREANYTNLSPGSYVFRVRVKSSDSQYKEIFYRFSIKRAIWQQTWFLVIATILSIAAVYLLFRIRLRIVKKKNQLKLDLAESRQKAMLQVMNPHFIFNLLNNIQGSILTKDNITSASLLSQFARLMRQTVQMGKKKHVSLEQEIDFLDQYLKLESLRAPGKFTYYINMDPALKLKTTLVPTLLIQPFIENAIKHGVMHLPNGKAGIISITFSQKGNELYCHIDDNGVGRVKAESIKAGMNEHESSGIEITLKRLRLLHEENRTPYYYRIEDKYAENADASGTRVILSVPFKKLL